MRSSLLLLLLLGVGVLSMTGAHGSDLWGGGAGSKETEEPKRGGGKGVDGVGRGRQVGGNGESVEGEGRLGMRGRELD